MCRPRLLAGVAATCIALSSISPSVAHAGFEGAWVAGVEATGASTIIGRIEAPRARQSVKSGANLLVSGWAADTTASGWSGIDGVEVWSGDT